MADPEDVLSLVRGLAELGGPDAQQAVAEDRPFAIVVDDVEIRVAYTSGTTPTVFLSTAYAPRVAAHRASGGYRAADAPPIAAPRPLRIELARESDDDRQAKARGIAREVQTGDADFDRECYISSGAQERVVAAVVASAALRRAVQTLFGDGFKSIWIDDDDARITTQRGLALGGGADATTIARALATIANEVPPVEGRYRRPRSWPAIALFGLSFAAPAGVITAFVVGSFPAVFAGVTAGVGAGVAAGVLVGRTQRGRSDSHWRIRVLVAMFCLLGGLAGAAGALVLSGAGASALWWFAAIPIVIAASIVTAVANV